MKRGPKPGRAGATSALDKASAAWGEMPPEIEALARACDETPASVIARRLGYSPAVISHMLGRKYPGDVDLVLAKIRGELMGEMVSCPVLGDIGIVRCLAEQKRPFAATNSIRARLYHACRPCPHNRKNLPPSDAEVEA